MVKDKPLLILKASAGSGKTFRLVEEFLQIILNEESDSYYQSVLALTFTNKAAAEMKERIIEALEVLSKNPDEDLFDAKFLEEKSEKLGLSPEKVRGKSKNCLNEIIHNYGNLSVMTIDKFSHKIVRAFARDLDLESDFGIELDTDELKNEVIAEIIDSYGKDKELSNILYQYSKSNTDEGSVWNVGDNLFQFSKTIDGEKYERELEELKQLDDDKFDSIHKELTAEVSKLEKSYDKQISVFIEFLETLSKDHSDYAHKSTGIYGNILRKKRDGLKNAVAILSNKNILKYYEKNDFGGKQGAGSIVSQNSRKISEFIEIHDKFIEGQKSRYGTLKLILSKIFNIRLIRRIQNTVDQLKAAKNIKEIGDLNKEIAQIILSESVPFIYERIGERYKHFLLDEFQDTSVRQWQNLIPLVENGLAENKLSLIVGDAKQSIYRFRNGEVEQFVQLPDLYNPGGSEIIESKRSFFQSRGIEDPLEDNWRSKEEIVEFNNEFFTTFAKNLSPEYQNIYTENLKQNPQKSSGGYVQVQLEEEFNEENKVERTIDTIMSCLEDGFKPGDICLILRNKRQGVALAQALEIAKIPVISDESLFVNSDVSVQLMITILALIEDSHSYEMQTLFAEKYLQNKKESVNDILNFIELEEGKRIFRIDAFLEKHELPKLNDLLSFDSLVELVFKIRDKFQMDYEENPYLELFFEQVYQYEIKNSAYLKGFVEWWKEKGVNASIAIPESTDAVRIMTIHKSKGLQFPVVIIPFADWGFGNIGEQGKKDTLWVNRENGILDTFCIETKNPDNEEDLELKKVLQKEKDQMILDETNNLYVAFTRPKERLYVFGELKFHKKKGEFDPKYISSRIYQSIGEEKEKVYGDKKTYAQEKLVKGNEIALSKLEESRDPVVFSFQPIIPNPEIQYNIDFGVQLHTILSKIEAETDLENLDSLVSKEGMSEDESLKLKSCLIELFNQSEIRKDLFENNVEVYSEYEIIQEDGSLLRPDRVLIKKDAVLVVDFKTGKPRKKDQNQLNSYVKIIEGMGMKNVSGKLIYTESF